MTPRFRLCGVAEGGSGFFEGFGADDDWVQFVAVQVEEVRLHPGSFFSEAASECGVGDDACRG